jgi:hypothetical protein
MTNTLDVMWRTYDAINGWIKFSDTKAGAISAADIAILAMLFSKFADYNNFIFSHQSVELFLVFSVVCGVLSIVFSTVSLCPKVNASSYKSLIFFGSIANNYDNYNKYKIEVGSKLRDDRDLLDQIAEQVWINSRIACDKYSKVRWAMCFFLIMLILIFVAGIIAIYSIRYQL